MRTACNVATHRMELNCVHDVVVGLQCDRLLEFELRIQTPQIHCAVSRGSSYVRTVCVDFPRHWVKSDVDNSVCMPFELCAQFAVGDTPNFAVTAPATCRKKLLVRGEAAATDTTVISVLAFSHGIMPDPICYLLKICTLLSLRQSVLTLSDAIFEYFKSASLQLLTPLSVKDLGLLVITHRLIVREPSECGQFHLAESIPNYLFF